MTPHTKPRFWAAQSHNPVFPEETVLLPPGSVLQITQAKARRLWFYGQPRKNVRFLERYVKRGWLGVKSGQGFYTYPSPAFQQVGFVGAPEQARRAEAAAE